MTRKSGRYIRLWLVLAVAVIFWTVGAGFYRDLSAGNDETYKGLKIFSDVLDLIEKNYVDPVDTTDLIHKAIQGMVHSLDPHSALLPPDAFEEHYRQALPETVIGSEFLDEYKTHGDPITQVQPDARYRVLGPAQHPIYENQRVLQFMDHLRAAASGQDEEALVAAGQCMFGSHDSYRDNCLLSVDEVDFIVDAVRARCPDKGLYGAKITGGGSGGTVAVFGRKEALAREIPAITREYKRLTGLDADIFDGTSPGAIEFGSFQYTFGPTGWIRSL